MTLEDMGSERWEALVRGLAAQIINATEPKAACALAADLLALLLRSVAVSACDTPDEGNETAQKLLHASVRHLAADMAGFQITEEMIAAARAEGDDDDDAKSA